MCAGERSAERERRISNASAMRTDPFRDHSRENKVKTLDAATDGDSHDASNAQADPLPTFEQMFGHARPGRLHQDGRRTVVYRRPYGNRRSAVSKTLACVIALLLVAFAAGYIHGWGGQTRAAGGVLPASGVPANSTQRLITTTALCGAISLSARAVAGEV